MVKLPAASTRSRGVKVANNTTGLYKQFPELEYANPETEHLLSEIIDGCTSYNELLLRVAATHLERRLSFGTMIQLLFWANIERIREAESLSPDNK